MASIISDQERFKLYRGPYAAPKCAVDRPLYCEYRGKEVKVRGLTDAPIIWPYSQNSRYPSLILCGDLARAVRVESVRAIAHHWGVKTKIVWKWRKALGVPMWNEGSSRLHQVTQPERYDPDSLEEARRKSRTRSARAKMSATRKGRPAHPNLRAAALKAARAPKPESFKRKLSRRLKREWKLGLRRGHPAGRRWTDVEIARVGTDTDAVIASELGRTVAAVTKLRLRLSIPIFQGRARRPAPTGRPGVGRGSVRRRRAVRLDQFAHPTQCARSGHPEDAGGGAATEHLTR